MEDGVTVREAESMAVLPMSSKIDGQEKENHVGEAQGEEKAAMSSGFMKNIISSLVSCPGEDDKETGNGVLEAGDGAPTAERDGGGGGLVDNLISNLFHQSEDEEENEPAVKRLKTREEEVEEEDGGGGLINNLISNLFHHTHTDSENGGEERKVKVEETDTEEDAAPTSDEAAILIHSIIHD